VQKNQSSYSFCFHPAVSDGEQTSEAAVVRYGRALGLRCCMWIFLLCSVGSLQIYGQTNGPAGYWSFDTASITGTHIADQSGNALSGTISGSVTPIPGIVNQGLSFGGNGVIQFSSDSITDLTNNMTLALWVRTQNKTRDEALMTRYNAAGAETGYLLRTDPAGHVELVIGGNNTTTGHGIVLTNTGAVINDGQWHHVAAVLTLGQGVSFYIDGSLSSTQALNLTSVKSGTPLQIGLNPWTAYGAYFTGSLDEVRIYNRAVSAAEIAALFAASQVATVSAPVITPAGGTFTDSVSVSLATSSANSSIYFTTDGSNPTTASTKYSAPLSLTKSLMVKAKAVSSGLNDSAISSAAFTISSSTPPPPSTGMVGNWTLDTANVRNGSALDSSGNNLTGTVVGGATSGTGMINQGLFFDGASGYIRFPLDTVTDLNSDLSLALWVNTVNKNRSEALVSRYAAGGVEHGYLVRTEPSGHIQLIIGGTNNGASGRAVTLSDTGAPVNDGKWHHVAVVVALGKGVNFFVDGQLSSTQAMNIVPGASGSALQFGLNPWTGYGTYFTGGLDDVRIYNRALQSAEVTALANVGSQNPPPGVPSLSASPLSLSFSGTSGSSNPAAQSVSVSYSGTGSWTATANQSWIALTTTATAISVGANINGLAAGTYSGLVTITAPGVTSQVVRVSLTVSTVTVPPPVGTGTQRYVSPTGSPAGDGTVGNPWDLATALAGPAAVKPGDTIWLRGGLYGGANGTPGTSYTARIGGTATQPIIIRQYPGERATVNGNLSVYGPYVYYWGFEVTSLNPNRSAGAVRYECMDTYPGSTGVKIINMVLHDCLQGIGFWVDALNSEASGNIIYYNGEQGSSRGLGHGIYAQNNTGTKLLKDNIVFSSFDINMQFYGSGAAFVKNFKLDGNVTFNAGNPAGTYVDQMIFAVGSGLDNISVQNTYSYQDPRLNSGYSRLGWQFGGVNGSLTQSGNYWIGGNRSLELWGWTSLSATNNTYYSDQGDEIIMNTLAQPTSGYSFSNNTYYGSGLFNYNNSLMGFGNWQTATGLDKTSRLTSGRPTGVWSFVRPNAYESGRANIVIYNWDLKPSVPVDVSAVLKPGDSYVVKDAENFYGSAVLSGTYSGGSINVPMTGLTVAPTVGTFPVAPKHTAPEFGVFVVLKQ